MVPRHLLKSSLLLAAGLIFLVTATPAYPALARAPSAIQNSPVTITPGNPIEIAVAMDYSWPTVQDMFDDVEMAITDYGQIKGFNLQENHYDAGNDQTGGQNAANSIVANPMNVGVIGPFYPTAPGAQRQSLKPTAS